jgi:hypothetical protein
MALSEIIKLINSFKDIVKSDYKAEVVGIFGSFVRGGENRASDIDILVKFDDEADLFDFVGLSLFLEEKLGRRVDVVPYDTVRTELRDSILKETVLL